MEISLNLAWAVLATAMFVLWLRFRPHHKASGGMQLAALTVCVLILLPVISISDDLLAVQFPGETDTSLRWGHRQSINHLISHLPLLALHTPSFCLVSRPLARIGIKTLHMSFIHPQVSIRLLNRPPPAA